MEQVDWNGGFVVSREDPQKAWLSDTNTSGPFRGSIPILMGEVSTPKRQLQVSNNEVRATALISLAAPSSSALHLLIPTSLQSCTKSSDPRLQYRTRYRRAIVSSKNQCVGEPHHVTLSAKEDCELGNSQTKTTSKKRLFHVNCEETKSHAMQRYVSDLGWPLSHRPVSVALELPAWKIFDSSSGVVSLEKSSVQLGWPFWCGSRTRRYSYRVVKRPTGDLTMRDWKRICSRSSVGRLFETAMIFTRRRIALLHSIGHCLSGVLITRMQTTDTEIVSVVVTWNRGRVARQTRAKGIELS